jgi:gamma-tubulin complex component 4
MQTSLDTARMAIRYKFLKDASRSLRKSSEYVSGVCSTLSSILREYEDLIVDVEGKILKNDPSVVMTTGSFVPLATVRAAFAEWDAPLAALESLVVQLQSGPPNPDASTASVASRDTSSHWPPGPLIDMLLHRSQTGVRRIADFMSQLTLSVQRIWRIHLISLVIHGTLSSSDPLAEPKSFHLRDSSIPSCISPQSRESISYIGKAIATVKAAQWKNQIPRQMSVAHTKMLENVLPQDRHAFDSTIQEIRTNISEWLWANVLTQKDVDEAVDSL